ncbi:MAG: hypothetical protein J5829_02820 [Lachnospiraceae bacterium]|nr:hypothetical protein [Lachnospiraceae bacterium]
MKLKHYLRGLGLGIIVSTLIVSAGKNGRAAELSNDEIKAKARQLGMVEEDEMLLSEAQSLAKQAEEKDREQKNKEENKQTDEGSMEPVSENGSEKNVPVSTDSASNNSQRDEGTMEGSFLGAGAGSSDASEKTSQKETSQNSVTESRPSENRPSESKPSESKPEKQEKVTVEELENRNSDAGRASGNEERVAEVKKPEEETQQPVKVSAPVSVTIVKGESSTAVAKKLQNAGVITDAAQFDSYLCLNGFDRKLVTGAHTIPAGATAREVAEIITGR